MSRVIGCSLIVLVLFQQVFCQEEFQRLVIERLEKVEKENVRLSNENRQLKTRLEVYENNMIQLTANMQNHVTDLKSNLKFIYSEKATKFYEIFTITGTR